MINLQNLLLASVLICTRNRASYLRNTILKAAVQTLSAGSFEIVIVDNGSTDRTAEVVHECQSAVTTVELRYVVEVEVGLSAARNRAIREANGQILCFLDDDALPEPGWLDRLCKIFQQNEKVMCAGGTVIPDYETEPPSWFDEQCEGIFAPKFKQHSPHMTTYPYYPYGANFAVRSTVFRIVGMFDPTLGYRGTSLIPAEETEFIRRIERAGYQIGIDPGAVVRHLIPSERLTENYMIRRAYFQGRANAILHWRFTKPMPLHVKRRLCTLLCLLRNLILLYGDAARQRMRGSSRKTRKKLDWYLRKGYVHQEFILYLQEWH